MTIDIMPSLPEHVGMLCDTIRDADAREIEKLGFTPRRGLWRSYRGSISRETAFINGQIAAMWGLGGNPLGETGHPWILTANAANDMPPINFALLYRKKMRDMLKLFPVLQSWVDADHGQCVRLMNIIGFKLVDEKWMGPMKSRFFSYEMRAQWA